jgi:histidinol-phosphate aminotransferase
VSLAANNVIAGAPHLAALEPYDPKYWPARVYLNANENPYGLPEALCQELAAELARLDLHRYPDPLAATLRQALADKFGLAAQNVLVGNGGDELLLDLWMAYGGPGRTLLSCPPTFSVYAYNALLTFTGLVELPRRLEHEAASGSLRCDFPREQLLTAAQDAAVSLVVIASPNNPTGECIDLDYIEQLLQATQALVLLDQAYLEFADERFDARWLLERHANLVILRTFSKAYALAGVRVGYLLAAPAVVDELKKVRQPYSVNRLSARLAELALRHEEHYQEQIAEIIAQRGLLQDGLRARGMATAASEANFILLQSAQAPSLWRRLYDDYGILLRDLSASPGLEGCLRISVGRPEENAALLEALDELDELYGGSQCDRGTECDRGMRVPGRDRGTRVTGRVTGGRKKCHVL